jgi:hypothetical protein
MRRAGLVMTAAVALPALLVPALLGPSAPTASAASASAAKADAEATQLLKPPVLDHPVVRTIAAGHTSLKLDPARDYVLRISPGAVLTKSVTVVGGHNVVLESGTLRYAPPAGASPTWTVRGLYLKGQTGTMYVQGLTIQGPLDEGINLDQREPGAVVVLRDITVDLVHGTKGGHHADLLQTWAGPSKLVVDGFTGSSTYQGFFLRPNQRFQQGSRPTFFYLRKVDLDVRTGAYALWTDGHNAFPLHVRSTTVAVNPTRGSRDEWLWPKPSTGDKTWSAVTTD